jgi:hypothetical protein
MRTLILAAVALGASAAASAQEGKVSDKAVKQAIKDEDRKALDAAVRDLVVANSLEAMKILLAQAVRPAMPDKITGREDVWWMDAYMTILNAAASFTDPAALGELANFILKNSGKPAARDAMAMVCNHGQKALLPLCLKVLEAGVEDLKIMAVDHLIAIGDKSVVEPLIKALKANEKNAGDLKGRLGRALTVLTGQDYGDSVSNWLGWWDANKDKDWDVKGPEGGSTGTVTDGLDRSRHSEFEKLKKTGKLLVLQAGDRCKCKKNHDLDNIDRITSKMGLTTETIDKVDFETKALKLEEYVAILANCTHIREHCCCPECKPGNYTGNRLYQCVCPINKHDPYAYVLGEKGVAKIKKYVEGGGYLFAEDWCMEDFLGKAFGDYVTHGSVRSEDETVPVLPKAGAASHPYLRKIFFKPPAETRDTLTESDLERIAHVWKIDKETRTIRVKDPKRVVTLLTSPHLEKYAQGDDAVAVTFEVTPPGAPPRPATATGPEISQDRRKMTGGRVLYVLSHFGKQESQKDEYALQNLLINFLVEANERRGAYAPPAAKKK